MQQRPKSKFTLATNAQLVRTSYRERLKLAARNCGISDRDFATAVQDALLHVDMQHAEIWTAPELIEIPLIDGSLGRCSLSPHFPCFRNL